jgi:hypothetical protein
LSGHGDSCGITNDHPSPFLIDQVDRHPIEGKKRTNFFNNAFIDLLKVEGGMDQSADLREDSPGLGQSLRGIPASLHEFIGMFSPGDVPNNPQSSNHPSVLDFGSAGEFPYQILSRL